MSDLVDRLREYEPIQSQDNVVLVSGDVLVEAADEIERLRGLLGRDARSTAEIFDTMWAGIQHSERPEIKAVRRKLSIHELRIFLQLVFNARDGREGTEP